MLVLTTPEAIEARTDPWDPDSAPSAKEAEAAKHAEEAARYLAEGEAELDAMLGMTEAKRQVALIRSTTKVNQARAKMGLPVSVTSRHTLLVGPPGVGENHRRAGADQAAVRAGCAAPPVGGRDQEVKAGR